MSEQATLDIVLQGKEYRVACPPEERKALEAAASLLQAKMAEMAQKTTISGERLAVMAALNLAHEVLALQTGPASGVDAPAVRRRIGAIEAKLVAAIAEQQQDLF